MPNSELVRNGQLNSSVWEGAKNSTNFAYSEATFQTLNGVMNAHTFQNGL